MSITIESLELEVLSSSKSAASGLDALSASLEKLKVATKGGLGLTAVANQLKKVNEATNGISETSVGNVTGLAKAIQLLSGTKISSTIATQITAMSTALGGADFSGGEEKLKSLVNALSHLSNLPKSNLASYVNNLKKLPEVLNSIDDTAITTLKKKIEDIAEALKPLGDEMQKISNGFSAFPAKLQKLVANTDKLSKSNDKASLSYVNLYSKIKMAYTSVKTIGTKIGSAIKEMNSYIENMNLFTVAMGEYSSEAQSYAESVGELMGIDPGEWMRNQGVFMTLATGFGVAGDRAATMSQQLTQLGYDISSFYNISVEDAMQKLQSGLSGELEPLRRLGYDLSQAKLQATALSLGIEKSVSSMTQAEKAQLRYYAIMTQVTTAQGDMKRTLDAPANQLRVLKSQVTQAARAIGSIFIPILNAVLPYVTAFTKVIRNLASSIASVVGFEMPEVDYSGLDMVTGGAEDASDALDDASESAKKLKSHMAGFDELNIIGSENDGVSDILSQFDFDLPTYDFITDAVETNVNEIVNLIEGALDEIATIVSGASLAIGTILAVTGVNIPLGIALMSIGAVGLVTSMTMNWNSMSDSLAETLTTVTSVISGFLLAIGAFLAFSGVNVPLGIALMAVGAVSLASAAVINWKFLNGDVENAISSLTGIVGGALLAMGALFTFTGVSVGLGIALMAAGAVGIATAVGLNWDSMSEPMKETIGALGGIVGGALLTLGAVLAFTGVNIPLGVALMAGGAISLISAVALNWSSMNGDLEDSINTIVGIVGGALLGIGAILAFTGANIPLGIGLMAGGAVALGSSILPKWGAITKEVQNTISIIMAAIGGAAMVVGLILLFTGVGTGIGLGLLWGGAASLGTAVALNWNFLTNKVGEICNAIVNWAVDTGSKIKSWWNSIPTWFNETIITPVGNFFKNLWSGIKTKASDAWTGVKNAFSSAGDWFKTKITEPVGNFFNDMWSNLKSKAKSAWSGVKEVFGNVGTFFKDTFESAWKKVTKVFSVSGEIFVDIKDGIVDSFKSIVNSLIKGINKVVKTPFEGINTVLKKIRDVKIVGIEPFKDLKTISVPEIPLLAGGGMVNSGQMFIAREAGAELVGNIGNRTAVMNNDQIVESVSTGVYQAVVAALGGNGDDGGTQIVINLDGEKIYENQQKIARGRGYNLGMGVFSFG